LALSVVTVWGAGQLATPLVLSEQVKFTVTLELFQPVALGVGVAEAEMVGRVLSTLTETEMLALIPALLTADPVTI